MTDPGGGPLRVLRAALLTGLAVGLGAGGHTMAGHHSPAPAVLALSALLAAPILLHASERQWTRRQLLVLLGGVQGVTHVLLTTAGRYPPGGAGTPPGGHQEAHVPGATGPSSAAAGEGGSAVLTTLAGSLTPGMVAAHAVATVVVAHALTRLDVVLGAVVSCISPQAPGRVRLPTSWRRPLVVRPTLSPLASTVVGARSVRGPPLASSRRSRA